MSANPLTGRFHGNSLLAGLFLNIQERSPKERFLRATTHDGMFHLDDCVCLAMWAFFAQIANVSYRLRRTRDLLEIDESDVAFDTGLIHDKNKFRHDHHGSVSPLREKKNDIQIPYSSAGLMWRDFGPTFVSLVINRHFRRKEIDPDLKPNLVRLIAKKVDEEFIAGVCACDAGQGGVKATENHGHRIVTLSSTLSSMNLNEEEYVKNYQEAQLQAQLGTVSFLLNVLVGCIRRQYTNLTNSKYVSDELSKTRLHKLPYLVLESSTQSWRGMMKGNPNILAVIQPSLNKNNDWSIIAVRDDKSELRMQFPTNWRGLQVNLLRAQIGIETAGFCHKEGMFASAGTLEDAIEYVKQAIPLWEAEKAASRKASGSEVIEQT